MRPHRILQFSAAAVIAATLAACGNAGDKDAVKCVLCGSFNDIRGAISDPSGNQSQVLAGWALAAIERDSRIARVAEIDAAGLYTLGHVNTDVPQTLALFSSDYILTGVLSMQSATPNTIHQFFRLKTTELPRLINKGPIISFQDGNGIAVEKDLASDQNGDGIPDGSVSIGAVAASLTDPRFDLKSLKKGLYLGGQSDSAQDIDVDHIPNEKDPDIDGDGIINILDPDDNGNGILDVFDPDANGDYKNDSDPDQHDTDQFFAEGVDWISAQFSLRPKDDGTQERSLTFRAKVNADYKPLAVQVRGAPSLLNNSYFIGHDAAGNELQTAFNRLLGDDGLSDDDAANDLVYGKKVILDADKAPRAEEAIFFQLVFGTVDHPWYMEFPYVFPPVKPAAITAQYDTNTKVVQLVGNPFGDYQSFLWHVNVYTEDGRSIWLSSSINGATRQATVPDNILEPGTKYKFDASAQTQDKVPGNPAYVIYTPKYDLQ